MFWFAFSQKTGGIRRWFLAFGLLTIPSMVTATETAVVKMKDQVILLHGMARSNASMRKIENYLKEQGYTVINDGYPSTKETVEKIAEAYLAPLVERCKKNGAKRIHLVTHSLGGIVVRQYLQTHSLPEGSRIVMISPPNQGSELADAFKDLWIYQWLNGPAGQVLGTGPTSLPNLLKPVDVEIGVITGDSSLNPFYSWLIPGQDDGKVSVKRARLSEMKDFMVVPSSHTFIMRHPEVLKQVFFFLKNGKFDHHGD